MWDLRIVVEPHAPDQLKQVVQEGLALYNVAATGLAEYYPVSIFLRDANDEILRWCSGTHLGQGAARHISLAGGGGSPPWVRHKAPVGCRALRT